VYEILEAPKTAEATHPYRVLLVCTCHVCTYVDVYLYLTCPSVPDRVMMRSNLHVTSFEQETVTNVSHELFPNGPTVSWTVLHESRKLQWILKVQEVRNMTGTWRGHGWDTGT
jgi:hypothetical protein